MNTKGALRKILSNLHPNTILKPNLDSNTHPQPSAYSYPNQHGWHGQTNWLQRLGLGLW